MCLIRGRGARPVGDGRGHVSNCRWGKDEAEWGGPDP